MLYELHVFIFHKIIKKNLGKQKIKVFFFYKDKQERVAIPKKKSFPNFFLQYNQWTGIYSNSRSAGHK